MARLPKGRHTWMVLNQSQSPLFQHLIESLTHRFGPALLVTGTPFRSSTAELDIRRATAYVRAGVVVRAMSWAAFCIETFVRSLTLGSGLPMMVTTNPPFLPHLAYALSRVTGNRYALLVWDIYPEHLIEIGWIRGDGLVAKLWRGLSNEAMLNASAIITLSNEMAATLGAQLGTAVTPPPIEVIPNWADTSSMKPTDKLTNPFAADWNQQGKITVLYSGNIGRTHGIGTLLEAAEAFTADQRIAFLLVGDGLGLSDLKKRADVAQLSNVLFAPLQPWAALPLVLATGDVAVVSQAPGTEHLSIPSKTYSYMAAGCALLGLCSEDSELGRFILANGIGAVSPHGDPARLTALIRAFVDDPEWLATCRLRARAVAEADCSPRTARDRFESALAPLFAQLARKEGQR